MIKSLYFCENCRKKIIEISQLHFVEENSDRGFCSEECIMEFYRPFMQEFALEESHLRRKIHLPDDEGHNEILANQHYLDLALTEPSEVWFLENDLEQSFYTHILEIKVDGFKFYFILICTHVDGTPSFVFYRTLTGSEELVNFYRRDYRYTDEVKNKAITEGQDDISDEIIEEIELKKSSFLAHVLQLRSDDDISLEDFLHYDQYLEKTIHQADEIYEFEDDDAEILKIYIKSYADNSNSFFYIVVMMKIADQAHNEIHVPIIGFPSKDKNLYKYFASGKQLNKTLKN